MLYNPFSLEGKTILVTGGSSGIGRSTAIECAKLGASVIIVGRNIGRLTEVKDALDVSIGQHHAIIVADLSSIEGIDEVVNNIPSLDGVVSNAGRPTKNIPLKFIKEQEISDMFQMNTYSHVILAKLLFKKKLLNKGGSYVFTASIGGNTAFASGCSVYGMTKAAVNSFMKYCAVEFANRGVRCNCVCPGMIDTPFIYVDTLTKEDIEADAKNYLLKRYGKPEEVAHAIAFLLGDGASYITGTSLIVDGGVSILH